jgi:hypothetical protein
MANPADPPPGPEWAAPYVRALLGVGVSVPDIERRLVTKGVAPAAATAVVQRVLQERVREVVQAEKNRSRRVLIHVILSGVVACLSLILGSWYGEAPSLMYVLGGLMLPLGCIWKAAAMPWSWNDAAAAGTVVTHSTSRRAKKHVQARLDH